MSEAVLTERPNVWRTVVRILDRQRIWVISAATLISLFAFSPAQGAVSLDFVIANLLKVAPYLMLSIGLAAYAAATGADGLISRAFQGSPVRMIALAALAGGLSPFCSCGVIPLIAALLTMGVPLSAVMAFWLASPVMSPPMFVLTAGVLGADFAIAKTLAAVGIGLFGGYVTHALAGSGRLDAPLRPGVGNGGCGGGKVRNRRDVVWQFWREPARTGKFWSEGANNTLFLLKWLTLAFILESLILAYIPAEDIVSAVGGEGMLPILTATLIGVPAYLNGYAALPLVGGLVEQGMLPGAGMAFLVAGAVTSLPAAIAVWALVRKPVFGLYLALALGGSFASGALYQLWAVL